MGAAAARSASARSSTTTCRATASAMPPCSCAGAPTSRREDCRYDQLEVATAFELQKVFGAGKKT